MYFSSLEFLLRIRVIKVLLKNMQKLKKKKKKANFGYCWLLPVFLVGEQTPVQI